MKRTKQLQTVVNNVNDYLRTNKIKDEKDPAFHMLVWSLLQTDTYKGFNYFRDKEIDGETVSVLAGSSIDFDYLQLY